MAGRLHGDLENLQTSYSSFNAHDHDRTSAETEEDEDDDIPPSYQQGGGSPWYQNANSGLLPRASGHKPHLSGDHEPPSGGVIIHTVPEGGKSRWSHIEDLDSFFKNVYTYHQKHGFQVMLLQKFSELLQVVFILFLSVYLYDCVDYSVLFNNSQPEGKVPGEKVTLADVVSPPGECMARLSFWNWLFLLVGMSFWTFKLIAIFYQFFQFWDIKRFYNQALGIADSELDSITWRDVQRRLVVAQTDHLMCIHKEQLTDLDIYHRILRFKNYMVAMVNKDILPVRISVLPCLPSFVFLSHGLKFNLEWLFFKGPWAPFDKWHLKDDYKRLNKKKELTENLKSRILILALVNLVMMPLIFFWQLLYCFFNYAELVKREPGSLGVRKWSHFGRLYLRHLNELDHELMGRLNQAYKPANQYMEIFVSPMSVVIARFFTFMAGSVLAIFIALSVWDEDVLYVEHVLTIITILGGIIAISRVFIPDENMVFCPEKTLTAVIAHIHYFPLDDWKGRAHTFEVMSHLNELFPYTALTLLQELMSPIVTPLVLLLMLRPRASTIIDFFRNFTVDVTGVGDVCSFAQMDVRRHGNPNWQNTGDQQTILSPGNEEEQQQQPPTAPRTQTNAYTQAEDGKTEMSLIHFTLANPGWTPPPDSKEFISAFRGHATREVETLPALREEELMNNVLYSSLTSLDAAGGVYSDLANNLLTSIRHQRHEASSPSRQVMSPQFDTDQDNDQEGGGSMMQSIREGLGTATTELSMMMPPPPNLRQDLRRLGLEYTGADMSLSALFLHEMHQRSSASCHHNNSGSSRQTRHLLVHPDNVARPTAQDLTDLAEGPEENVPLVDTSTSSDSNKLVSISNVA